MKTNQNDAFIKLNFHKRINENDVEIAQETDAFTKAEIARIKEKIQRKQLEHQKD